MSVTDRVPLALPVTVGAKLTLMVHELPAATLDPQLFVCEKPELAANAEIVSATPPLFVSVICWD